MQIGLPKEIKDQEFRVGLTPATVQSLCQQGHQVVVEGGAGAGAGFRDEDYKAAGAMLVSDAAIAWQQELVVKVKEPQPREYEYFRDDLMLFTYLHLAAEPMLTKALLESGIHAIAYETVAAADGKLPLLTPMSVIAGRLSVQFGARYLERQQGGRG
ncbi:MAG: alanine dehydrogenase, partial [Cyanobacteria bacterium P01_D01_bin.128]